MVRRHRTIRDQGILAYPHVASLVGLYTRLRRLQLDADPVRGAVWIRDFDEPKRTEHAVGEFST